MSGHKLLLRHSVKHYKAISFNICFIVILTICNSAANMGIIFYPSKFYIKIVKRLYYFLLSEPSSLRASRQIIIASSRDTKT